MISTVFASTTGEEDQWRAELLEASWHRAAQPGALFRLIAARTGSALPRSRLARHVATLPFLIHPYTGDDSPAYLLPAGLLEWLIREKPEGTVLLLESSSVFLSSIDEEMTPGKAIATPWPDLPQPGTGPFGLGQELSYLARVCADQALEVPRATLPALVHSRDLLRLAPRWLELTTLLRAECREWAGWSDSTHRLAFAIALAEWELDVEERPLAVGTHEQQPSQGTNTPVLTFGEPLHNEHGQVIWDPAAWQPWTPVDPEATEQGLGRELLKLIAAKIAFDSAGGALAVVRPQRRQGIREARVLDRMLLEIPGQEGTVSLNPSSARIWWSLEAGPPPPCLTRKPGTLRCSASTGATGPSRR